MEFVAGLALEATIAHSMCEVHMDQERLTTQVSQDAAQTHTKLRHVSFKTHALYRTNIKSVYQPTGNVISTINTV